MEQLLYGNNYEVWFNLYGPTNTSHDLETTMKKLISKESVPSEIVPSSPSDAKSKIIEMVLSEGDRAYGPIDLKSKSPEICTLLGNVFSDIALDDAEIVSQFGFSKGHPHYPVFWDFAYDIHYQNKRWLFLGSSSD